VDAHSAARSSALAADVFIGVGIVAVAAGAYLLLTSKAPPVHAVGRGFVLGASW
jgi:hypothetical protein